MNNKYFEKKMEDFFKSNPHLIDLLKNHTNINDNYFDNSYEFILEESLFNYGILSINIHNPSDILNKFSPYIRFSKNNIFNEEEGLYYLFHDAPVTLKQAGEKMADYFMSKLTFITNNQFIKPLSKVKILTKV